jgi:hypothetical protein
MNWCLFGHHQWDFLLRPNTLNSVEIFCPSYFDNLELIARHYQLITQGKGYGHLESLSFIHLDLSLSRPASLDSDFE